MEPKENVSQQVSKSYLELKRIRDQVTYDASGVQVMGFVLGKTSSAYKIGQLIDLLADPSSIESAAARFYSGRPVPKDITDKVLKAAIIKLGESGYKTLKEIAEKIDDAKTKNKLTT